MTARPCAALLLALMVHACGGSTEPSTGILRVALTTAGAGLDDDGVTVEVDDREARALASGSLDFLLNPGSHTVRLTGVAPNCSLDGPASRTVTMGTADTASIEFALSCTAVFGTLRVLTRTTGPEADIDPSGYTVMVDDQPRLAVGANGSVLFGIPAGRRAVGIADLAANCVADGAPRAVDVASGGTITVEFTVVCHEASPAGRGNEIAFARNQNPEGSEGFGGDGVPELYVMNADGTHARKLPTSELLSAQRHPAWAPDGSRLVFLGFTVGFELHLFSFDLATEERRTLSEGCRSGVPSWSPDGARIACQDQYEVLIDTTGTTRNILDLLTFNPDGTDPRVLVSLNDVESPDGVTWSPDGSRLAYAVGATFFDAATNRNGRLGEIFVVNADGSDLHQLTATDEPEINPAWSPDGSRLAFASSTSQLAPLDIYVMNADGSDRRRLTNGGENFSPDWSPDGTRIAFVSRRDGNAEIYVMNADGSRQERITDNPAFDGDPHWRP